VALPAASASATVHLTAGYHQLTLMFAGAGTSTTPKVQLQWSGAHCCGGHSGSCPIPSTKWCSCPPGTAAPTAVPTKAPTKTPTLAPTKAPTAPTAAPTKAPTTAPTAAPTAVPTTPTQAPTTPTKAPTSAPTPAPPGCPNGGTPNCNAGGPNCYCYQQGYNGHYNFNNLSGLKGLLSQWSNNFHDAPDDLDWYSGGQSLYTKCGAGATSAQWIGYITVNSDEVGSYTFYLNKDGGSAQLSLDGSVIIDTTDSACALPLLLTVCMLPQAVIILRMCLGQ